MAAELETLKKFTFIFHLEKNNLQLGYFTKQKNVGKGQEKFVLKTLPSTVSETPNFFVQSDWSINSWRPWGLEINTKVDHFTTIS